MTDTDLHRTPGGGASPRDGREPGGDASPFPTAGAPAAAAAALPMGPPRDVIRFEDVHFWQGPLQVLDGVSFAVPESKVTVVLGPSGTGKSTLLWLMLGLWKPDAGRILIDDEDTTGWTEKTWKEVRQRLSMVFQENALFDSLTVGENVGYCLMRSSDLPPESIERRVRDTLQLVELNPDEVIDRNPDQLSGGQKRRVAVARAVASCEPEVIFYDEPTTGLDPQTSRAIGDLIVKLRDRSGTTSVVVTHEIGDALRIGDRFLMLERGKVIYDGDAAGLLASPHPRVQAFLEPYLRSVQDISPLIGESIR